MSKKIKLVPRKKKPSEKHMRAEGRALGKQADSSLSSIAKAGVKKIVKDAKIAEKDAAVEWEKADAELKKGLKRLAGRADNSLAIPVESQLPGIARNPKPPKVHVPLAADGAIVSLEIISYHFLKLMERMAAEQGGTSAQALQDLKADIAKRKMP